MTLDLPVTDAGPKKVLPDAQTVTSVTCSVLASDGSGLG